MSLTERQMIKIARALGDLSPEIPASVISGTIDLIPAGVEKAATFVDTLSRSGRISFRDRDHILLELCGNDHVKMAGVEAELAKARANLTEKQASASQASDEFVEFLLS